MIQRGDVEEVKRELQRVSVTDRDMIQAIMYHKAEIVTLFIEAGWDVLNNADNYIYSLANAEIMSILLANGALPSNNIFRVACQENDLSMILLLADHGFGPDKEPDALATAIMYHCGSKKNTWLTRRMLKRGWSLKGTLRIIREVSYHYCTLPLLYGGDLVSANADERYLLLLEKKHTLNALTWFVCDRVGERYNTNAFIHLAPTIASYVV